MLVKCQSHKFVPHNFFFVAYITTLGQNHTNNQEAHFDEYRIIFYIGHFMVHISINVCSFHSPSYTTVAAVCISHRRHPIHL